MFSQSLLGSTEFSKAIQASINISGLLDESVLCAAKVRLRKRKREHYQTIQLQEEEDGPDPNIFTTGEFCGNVNEIKNDCPEFKNGWKKKFASTRQRSYIQWFDRISR